MLINMLHNQSNSDWLFMPQSRVMKADWLILENSEKTTKHNDMPYRRLEDNDTLPIKYIVDMLADIRSQTKEFSVYSV